MFRGGGAIEPIVEYQRVLRRNTHERSCDRRFLRTIGGLCICINGVSRRESHAACEKYSVSACPIALADRLTCIGYAALRRQVADDRLLPKRAGRPGLLFSVREHGERRCLPRPARYRG